MGKHGFVKLVFIGIFIFLLCVGINFIPVDTEASSVIRMRPGQSRTMKLPKGWKSAKWSSNKKKVAKVSAKGVVKAVAPGKAVITAKNGKRSKKYTCIVKRDGEQKVDTKTYQIQITAGDRKFSAVLDDNETVRAFLKKLPMTITMNELNGNEKYYYFSDSLPKDSTKQQKIHTGDLMLYGSDCLVLFYEDFSTSYSYTPLGRVSNPDGLAEALGSGNVKVVFSLE